MKKLAFTMWALALMWISVTAQTYRYTQSVFPGFVKISDIVYSSVPSLNSPFYNENSTTMKDFKMDIFLPDGDNFTSKPAIIFAHGGGFVTGNRGVDDMLAFCEEFAKLGYVTATIDYRQGVEVADNADLHYTRAAWRGLQDGRSAVRFLRANAASYGINPDMIYWGGNSAGSVIGLNTIYLDNNEKPAFTGPANYNIGIIPYSGPDLGPLDIGDNLEFDGQPDAVMACWGGISNPQIIQKNNSTPVFLIHGTADNIVPFNSGPPFNLSSVSPIFGSNQIYNRLLELEMTGNTTYFVEGEGHEFYGVVNGNWSNGIGGNAYWDIIVDKTTMFLYEQHKPLAAFDLNTDGLNIELLDQSEDPISWIWDFGDGITDNQQNPTHTYDANGDYKVELYIENNIHSWDTCSQIISVSSSTSISKTTTPEVLIYPNPVRNILKLDFGLLLNEFEIRIYNLQGSLVCQQSGSQTRHVEFDTNQLLTGTYFLDLRYNDRKSIHKILIF